MSPVKWYGETTESLAGKSLQELVHIWRSADTQVNWLKGDIAAEVDKSYGDDKLGEFAAMVDENKSTIQEYRRVAKAYDPKCRHLDISWSVHQVFAAEDERQTFLQMFKLQGKKTVKDAKGMLRNKNAELTRAKNEKIRTAEGVIVGIVSTSPDGITKEGIREALKAAGLESPEAMTREEYEIIDPAFGNVTKDKRIVKKDDRYYPPGVITGPEAEVKQEVKQEEVKLPTVPQARDLIIKALETAGESGLEVFTLEGFDYEDLRVRAIGGSALTSLLNSGYVRKDGSRYYLKAEIFTGTAKDLDTDYLARSMVDYFGAEKARELAYTVLGIVEPDSVEKVLGSITAHPSAGLKAEKKEETTNRPA